MKRLWPISLLYISVAFLGFVDSQLSDTEKESKVITFSDWPEWQTLYKSCNPNENPYNSPVNISSSEAHKSIRQTLMVFSEKPEEDLYYFSTYYEVENMQMESFNIQLTTDDTYREATHVSGLGSPHHRFFKSALILFRTGNDSEPLDTQHHFHTIDGIEYPMEIVLNFETATMTEKTQIHVMVELSKEENPAWRPILDTFAGLKRKTMDGYCSRTEWINESKKRLEETKTTYMASLKTEKNNTDGQTYHLKIYELTALLDVLKDAKNESIENLTNLYKNATSEKLICEQQIIAVGARIKKLKDEIAIMSSKQSSGDAKEKKRREAVLNDMKQTLDKLSMKTKKALTTCIEQGTQKVNSFKRQLDHQRELLRKNRVGSDPTAVFSSVQSIAQTLDEMKRKFSKLKQALREYQDAQKELDKLVSIPKRAETIKDPFQVSWLFPPGGGYFSYKGSSLVPPCERIPFVIVLETPITISAEQLHEFQDFPSFTDPSLEQHIKKICNLRASEKNADSADILDILSQMKKLASQVPRSVPLGNRRVWYNSKNIQFIDDDGLHMKSSTRAKLRRQNSSAARISNKITTFLLINFISKMFRKHV